MPNLKNYTSSVPAKTSIAHIENKLAAYGALSISKWFNDDGSVAGLSFVINNNGIAMSFKIPAKVDRVEKRFLANRSRPPRNKEEMSRLKAQAARTAWKIMSDWIDIQLSLIDVDQVDATEVFLPYVFDGNSTFYEHLKNDGFKSLAQISHNGV
ncbi:MAG: hypothetical protein DRP09_10255 [Candidatus Thorarchaeota archaeon]|nr:MAG: hypothetical protein DRP09_10255 [Candidatus Thorarchaeota archaeon]